VVFNALALATVPMRLLSMVVRTCPLSWPGESQS
jgi:hypothetical protein